MTILWSSQYSINLASFSELSSRDPAVNPCVTVSGPKGGVFGLLVAFGETIDDQDIFASANPLYYWQRIKSRERGGFGN
jgi:hypothetical protein